MITNEMDVDLDVFHSCVEDKVVGKGDCRHVVAVNVSWVKLGKVKV